VRLGASEKDGWLFISLYFSVEQSQRGGAHSEALAKLVHEHKSDVRLSGHVRGRKPILQHHQQSLILAAILLKVRRKALQRTSNEGHLLRVATSKTQDSAAIGVDLVPGYIQHGGR
jgi:hypothetical protein